VEGEGVLEHLGVGVVGDLQAVGGVSAEAGVDSPGVRAGAVVKTA
jgi:hypothetical protein